MSKKIYINYDDFKTLIIQNGSEQLNQCTTLYKELIDKNRDDLDLIALLEETILQISNRIEAKDKFKLSVVRGYIYVRAPFYGAQNKNKDIRTVVGKVTDYGDDLNKLMYDPTFGYLAVSTIERVMTKKIDENLNKIEELKEKILSL